MSSDLVIILLIGITAALTIIGYLFICFCSEMRGPGPSMGAGCQPISEVDAEAEGGNSSQFIVLLPGITRSKGVSSGFGSTKATFDPSAPNLPTYKYEQEVREEASGLIETVTGHLAEEDSDDDNTGRTGSYDVTVAGGESDNDNRGGGGTEI